MRSIASGLILLLLAGCQGAAVAPTTTHENEGSPVLEPLRYVEPVRAHCAPPTGWSAEPPKTTSVSEHQVWISPTGATAFGVLNVRHLLLPLASDERILREFLDGMLRSEGAADLLEKQADANLASGLGGIRFIARGGRYTVRANLASRGRNAWIWYAGTLTGAPVDEAELLIAEAARERTQIGAP